MAPESLSYTAWYTGQPSQYGPRSCQSRRSASLSMTKSPLRVPTSSTVFDISHTSREARGRMLTLRRRTATELIDSDEFGIPDQSDTVVTVQVAPGVEQEL